MTESARAYYPPPLLFTVESIIFSA
ncbi:hypothetical protein PUN28_010643 [Cardiocondyla obscurior]|uniref:Uncharacterized protein n=1 Tax=Cardiocondyla obscurior TaxID=286306 RepID=A0AAW2FLB8_9HYME